MRALLSIACLWPGLPQAWLWGRLGALALAAAFAGALNLALIASFVWPQWPAASAPGATAAAAWILVLGLWIVGIAGLRRDWNRLFPSPADNSGELNDWFREAQTLYLKGHWIEAEALVGKIVARQPADIEAGLLIASIQRRTDQRQLARKTLAELAEYPAAARWRDEIAAELKQLSELEPTNDAQVQPTNDAQRNSFRKAA